METIYLIEDDADCSDVLKMFLENGRFSVRCFPDFESALENMDGPCMILMDLNTESKMTAEEFIGKVRASHPRIKIVLVSGQRNLQKSAEELGADGWLTKPYDISDIERLADENCERISA